MFALPLDTLPVAPSCSLFTIKGTQRLQGQKVQIAGKAAEEGAINQYAANVSELMLILSFDTLVQELLKNTLEERHMKGRSIYRMSGHIEEA